MEVCFVTARGQNEFFNEMVEALRDELDQIGIDSCVAIGGFPEARRGRAFVLTPPHEYFALTPASAHPTAQHLAHTVFICAEQPGTEHFDQNAELIRATGCPAFDINAVAARKLSSLTGKPVQHFQLGWTRKWAHYDPREMTAGEYAASRYIDILHLGSRSDRREETLAKAARYIHHRECRLVLGDASRPLTTANREWVGGEHKWDTLGHSRVLLNIHRDEEPYFEWLRAVQAIANGAVIVSDSSIDVSPLVPGEHFFEGPPEDLGLIADLLVHDHRLAHATASAAYELLVDSVRMSTAVHDLAEVCRVRAKPRSSAPAIEIAEEDLPDRARPRRYTAAMDTVSSVEADSLLRIEERMGHYLREQKLLVRDLHGDVKRLETMLRTQAPVPEIEIVHQSPALAGIAPRVSVVTPLFNYERCVCDALESAAASDLREIELIVVDDGSTDASLAAAERWMTEHPEVPAILLRHPVNRGLGQARNTAIGAARGEFVFALDADNSVYPSGISRLIRTLEANPGADFAWGYLQTHDTELQPVGLLSSIDWDPARFGDGNYIDAMVLWRRQALLDWGLYTTDSDLYGWEDFELFARVAEGGGHGVMTPQFVARYRVSGMSMLRTANMANVAMMRQLIEMYPTAMGSRPAAVEV